VLGWRLNLCAACATVNVEEGGFTLALTLLLVEVYVLIRVRCTIRSRSRRESCRVRCTGERSIVTKQAAQTNQW
jgi:hypothetical protein